MLELKKTAVYLGLLAPLFVIFLCACTPKEDQTQQQFLKDQALAVSKAKEEVINKLGWTSNIEVGDALFEDNRWVIHLWSLPKTPGGSAMVEVSKDGKASIPRMPR